MTDLITLTLPAVYLKNATSCALYIMHNMQVIDIVSFDVVDGQPVLRYRRPALDRIQETGAVHAQNP